MKARTVRVVSHALSPLIVRSAAQRDSDCSAPSAIAVENTTRTAMSGRATLPSPGTTSTMLTGMTVELAAGMSEFGIVIVVGKRQTRRGELADRLLHVRTGVQNHIADLVRRGRVVEQSVLPDAVPARRDGRLAGGIPA